MLSNQERDIAYMYVTFPVLFLSDIFLCSDFSALWKSKIDLTKWIYPLFCK